MSRNADKGDRIYTDTPMDTERKRSERREMMSLQVWKQSVAKS
jgi:hypothetical protein